MADTLIHVKGLADIQAFLDTLPAKLERNVVRGGLRAGTMVIKTAAVQMCPVGPPSSEGAKLYGLREGSLRDSIRVTTRVNLGQVTATVTAGGKNAKWGDVWYAHLIEFTGAKPHTITAKGMKSLSFGGLFFQSVNHPGMRPKPFMRPALDSQATNAVIAAAEYMRNSLATREGLEQAAAIEIGDE